MKRDEIQIGDCLRVRSGTNRFSGMEGTVQTMTKGNGGAWIIELQNRYNRIMRMRPSSLDPVGAEE